MRIILGLLSIQLSCSPLLAADAPLEFNPASQERVKGPDLVYTIERSINLAGAWLPNPFVNSSNNTVGFYLDIFSAGEPQVFSRPKVNVGAP